MRILDKSADCDLEYEIKYMHYPLKKNNLEALQLCLKYTMCSCFIEFIKLVRKKEIKCEVGQAFSCFFPEESNQFNNTGAGIIIMI